MAYSTKKDSSIWLFLHSCCAPCSSAVIERLAGDYNIVIFFSNPNIMPREEYEKRLSEQKRLVALHGVQLIEDEYENSTFLNAVAGFENEPEGGKRCEKCIELRLRRTAEAAKAQGFDFFTTTLSVSSHKNAVLINRILEEKGGQYGVEPLLADFKKNDGYKRSLELSKKYGLYRQGYCGCRF
ncbi:MAG: epoxyqueuosine reductase QueH [Oscillospiraceae bacterium]|nr:epoxyqueuosine reductase QueH [Oscillospiraceae bacterium]